MLSINSVKDSVRLSFVKSLINFLNSNSLPLVIASYSEKLFSVAILVMVSIVFSPMPLLGVFIILSKLTSSL